ncbi:MAG TPA: NAD-dependent epimerase/dehydratase family protein [Gammaproteobacteria bacterium]|jgi:NADH dehydrogenase|nr:NAD-dependent epimerase/dehydratase family protein [Gammaproteobacteria bacterium]HIK72462.1 NAD-dependent epimerase/dehydratase family protein [Gammaproteobacteria bacterium]
MKERVLITGANGNLGKKFLLSISNLEICALVRSEKAENDLKIFVKANRVENVEIVKCDYLDLQTIKKLVSSCSYVLHLVGVIKENKNNNFDLVHKNTTKVLVEAIKGSKVKKICYISIVGANKESRNKCFSSRGTAERLFLNSDIPCLILQAPMILGEGDYASTALKKSALSKFNFTFRKSSLEQPIYAGDIIEAVKIDINKCLNEESSPSGITILTGPTSLTREQLVEKAAKLLKVKVKVISLPLFLGYTLARIFEMLSSNPPISGAMLGVLDHDDDIDPSSACRELEIELTALDKMLERTIRP